MIGNDNPAEYPNWGVYTIQESFVAMSSFRSFKEGPMAETSLGCVLLQYDIFTMCQSFLTSGTGQWRNQCRHPVRDYLCPHIAQDSRGHDEETLLHPTVLFGNYPSITSIPASGSKFSYAPESARGWSYMLMVVGTSYEIHECYTTVP